MEINANEIASIVRSVLNGMENGRAAPAKDLPPVHATAQRCHADSCQSTLRSKNFRFRKSVMTTSS